MSPPRPLLSILVVVHNMRREAPRTLLSLTRDYQRGALPEYEVLVLENGSSEPLDEAQVRGFGREFSYHRLDFQTRSPVQALNHGAREARGDHLMTCIDGARILSPGILRESLRASRCHPCPVVATLNWHLGPEQQNRAVRSGYGRDVEDRLLEACHWQADGYALFEHACPGNSSRDGWFLPFEESATLTMPRTLFDELGGFEERFRSPGGGLASLDFFRRASEHSESQLVVLLGEATFHQIHGGVATNSPEGQHPWETFAREYEEIRGFAYEKPQTDPLYLGFLPPTALPYLLASAETACERQRNGRRASPLSGPPAWLERLRRLFRNSGVAPRDRRP